MYSTFKITWPQILFGMRLILCDQWSVRRQPSKVLGTSISLTSRGVVKSYDETLAGPSDRPWKIFWDDGATSSFNASDMLNFCINHTHGTTVTQVIESEWDVSESDDDLVDCNPTTAACDAKRAKRAADFQHVRWRRTRMQHGHGWLYAVPAVGWFRAPTYEYE